MSNKNVYNQSFDDETVNSVWKKGRIIPGQDPNHLRADMCGARIRRIEYGNTDSKIGWEIDHIKPISRGGGDELRNLQPLQWENNRNKGDDYPAIDYCVEHN